MSMMLKIHQGTGRLTGDSLCRSCENGMRVTDARGERIFCDNLPRGFLPRGHVTECSAYYNATLPSLSAMKETAWTLRTEKGGKAIGFAPPKVKREEDSFD